MKTVYIDGDILPYRVGFACQRTIYLLELEGLHSGPLLVTKSKREANKYIKDNPDIVVSELFYTESEEQARITLKLSIGGIVTASGCQLFKVVLSGPTNFRDEIATIQPYKGNREGTEKPFHWQMLRDWLETMPYTIVTEHEEADDYLSRAMFNGNMAATIDKDLDNTPGWHYNFNRNEVYYIDELQATRNFYTQCLTGDTADNIPGIKGIGPVKAKKLLADCDNARDMESVVLGVYGKHYPEPIQALTEVGQLLWMRREEGEMWTPLCGDRDK